MFKSVLVANRGEIALRIIRTAKRMGLRSIAVYSDADRTAMHVAAADSAVAIGPAPSADSYLRQDRLIEAALACGAKCVHPGCGFLAENASFAEACAGAGLVFVGPSPHAIRITGQKDEAKRLAASLGIPTVPGYAGADQDDVTFAREAAQIGYPVVLKAIAGGGGKGLKPVFDPKELAESAASARREAKAAFGDDRLMIEKLVEPARHIEMQIFGDARGNVVHLFERECTLQRRGQKVIEEAPAINMPASLRARMADAAVAAARAVGYLGAGTVEFLVPGGPLDADTPFYFMEMNTRLQIEHPVTELITGLDLVEWQFRVAAGEALPLEQDAIAAKGAAVEARLYAEDPATGFLPSPGRVWRAAFPDRPDVRVDSGVETGSDVPPFYDAMIAKIIGFGDTRGAAFDALLGGLSETVLAGPQTNLAFLHQLAARSATDGESLSTRYIENHIGELTQETPDEAAIVAGTLGLLAARQAETARMRRSLSDEPHTPWDIADGFQLGGAREDTYEVEANGIAHAIGVTWSADGPRIPAGAPGAAPAGEIISAGDAIIVWRGLRQTRLRFREGRRGSSDETSGGQVRSPMPGKLARLFVTEGDAVSRGDRIAIIEAMKMEHILVAPADGVVQPLPRREGEQVDLGTVIAAIETDGGHASD